MDRDIGHDRAGPRGARVRRPWTGSAASTRLGLATLGLLAAGAAGAQDTPPMLTPVASTFDEIPLPLEGTLRYEELGAGLVFEVAPGLETYLFLARVATDTAGGPGGGIGIVDVPAAGALPFGVLLPDEPWAPGFGNQFQFDPAAPLSGIEFGIVDDGSGIPRAVARGGNAGVGGVYTAYESPLLDGVPFAEPVEPLVRVGDPVPGGGAAIVADAKDPRAGGSNALVTVQLGDGTTALVVKDPGTGAETVLARLPSFVAGGEDDTFRATSISPDGNFVAFVSREPGELRLDLQVTNLDSGETRTVASLANDAVDPGRFQGGISVNDSGMVAFTTVTDFTAGLLFETSTLETRTFDPGDGGLHNPVVLYTDTGQNQVLGDDGARVAKSPSIDNAGNVSAEVEYFTSRADIKTFPANRPDTPVDTVTHGDAVTTGGGDFTVSDASISGAPSRDGTALLVTASGEAAGIPGQAVIAASLVNDAIGGGDLEDPANWLYNLFNPFRPVAIVADAGSGDLLLSTSGDQTVTLAALEGHDGADATLRVAAGDTLTLRSADGGPVTIGAGGILQAGKSAIFGSDVEGGFVARDGARVVIGQSPGVLGAAFGDVVIENGAIVEFEIDGELLADHDQLRLRAGADLWFDGIARLLLHDAFDPSPGLVFELARDIEGDPITLGPTFRIDSPGARFELVDGTLAGGSLQVRFLERVAVDGVPEPATAALLAAALLFLGLRGTSRGRVSTLDAR